MRIERTRAHRLSAPLVPTTTASREPARNKALGARPTLTVQQSDAFDAALEGRSIRPLSIDGTITDPATGGRADFDQGDSNACGTTALAIALHRMGIEIPRVAIDREIRNYDLYTPVPAIVDYARDQGLQANDYNEGSFEQLQRDVAAGRQILTLTDVGGYDANLDLQPGSKKDLATHWLVVTAAFEKDGEQYVSYMNPWGTKETLPYAQFDALWRDVRVLGVPTGYDRAYVLIDHDDAPALRRSNAGELDPINAATGGVSNVVNGWAELMRGEVLGGLGRIARGAVETVVGGAATLVATAGRAVGHFFRGLFGG